ncbi:IMPACT family protein, partial [gut metagenome]
MQDYRTIRGSAKAELVEKHSRFIASAAFVESEEEALKFLAQIRAANRTANHNVYA